MNRSQWRAEYRRNRATDRFIRGFKEKTGAYPEGFIVSLPDHYDFCRLHGDGINFRSQTGVAWSGLKLARLRGGVRLPA